MDVIQAIKSRRSVRQFQPNPVPKEKILKILDCARFAPTARNVQPWEFIVVTDANIRAKIATFASNAPFIKDSPVCIVVVCKDTKYYLEDGCAATQNILLAATELGLSSCWAAGDKKDYCQDVLGLLSVPQGYKLISMVAIGISAQNNADVPKIELNQLVHWEKF
jgi:nitroreductase